MVAASNRQPKRQLALRKGAQNGVVGELISLMEAITACGTITDSGPAKLRAWLNNNREGGLPAMEVLQATLDRWFSNGNITARGRYELYRIVERVLPPEQRQEAKQRRVEAGLLKRGLEREREDKERAHRNAERERNHFVYSANFVVKGVLYEGRWETVSRYLRVGNAVVLAREPDNRHDINAISIWVEAGHRIGYVPRDLARTMSELLDGGCKYLAYCTKILDGRIAPIPIVDVTVYRADATIADASVSRTVDPPREPFEYGWFVFGGLALVLLWISLGLLR